MQAELFEHLLQYDRKDTAILKVLGSTFASDPDYADALVELSSSEHPQVACGATWLLKAFVETGGSLSPSQTRDLISSLEQIAEWDAQLHVCQSVAKLTIPAVSADTLYAWLEKLINHERPFVRAWSIDAFCRLADQHNSFLPNAEKALKRSADDPAASVRARVRNLQKSFPY